MTRALVAILLALSLTACGEEEATEVPPPAKLDRTAAAYFTGMIIVDHEGPKGQIHLRGRKEPLWFSNVRDTVAFTMLPEESKDVAAIYVHDIGKAESWDHPGPDAWMPAREGIYVIGSARRGGMGAPEPVPFSSRQAAQAFADEEGGRLVTFDEIPHDFVFGDPHAPQSAESPSADVMEHQEHQTGEGQ
jgi:copper chaperone NosL